MKRTVWTFGLIAGGILSAMMLLTIPFIDRIGFDRGEVIGYTSMVLAFLLVFFGIRSYRDNVAGGAVSFGRALVVGLLIVLVASACYVATWELIYFTVAPDFLTRYMAYAADQARASGASPAEVQQKIAEMQQFAKLYQNPLMNAAFTFLEPLPVGLVFALVSAGVLSRKRRGTEPALAAVIG
ncbi:MAG TPA: DUF4199 domain-containing protein [Longimicrobium sp.]|jgi:hypothetical protein